MSQWLRQGTAAVVTFGPFLAKGNGVTVLSGAGIITSIDHATTGILLSKNGGAATIRHQAVSPSTYDAHGFFKVTLSEEDTDTLGTLLMMHSEPATYLSVWRSFMVIPAQVWDSLFGSDLLQVDVQEQANIDFGALQKASLNSATPSVTVSDKTGFSLSSDSISAIWHHLLTAISTAGSIGKLIKDYLDVTISSRATLGTGSIAWNYTLTNSETGLPISDAELWATTDLEGRNVIAVGRTNQNGRLDNPFMLDAGPIYIWRSKTGFTFNNPDTEVVSDE